MIITKIMETDAGSGKNYEYTLNIPKDNTCAITVKVDAGLKIYELKFDANLIKELTHPYDWTFEDLAISLREFHEDESARIISITDEVVEITFTFELVKKTRKLKKH